MGRLADEEFVGQRAVRRILANALAKSTHLTQNEIARKLWPRDRVLEALLITRTAVSGGGGGSWGAELEAADRDERAFIELLASATVFDGLPLEEIPLNVKLSAGDSAAGAGWVREGRAIPVSAPSFANIWLSRLKLGALVVRSAQLVYGGGVVGEALMRDALIEAARVAADSTFFDDEAAVDGERPAGMLHGVTPTAASGTDAEAVRTDIGVMTAALATAKLAGGPLVLVSSPALAGIIGLMSDGNGGRAFPGVSAAGGRLCDYELRTTDHLPDDTLLMLAPKAIVKAGTEIEISASTNATIAMSSAPVGDVLTPTGESAGIISTFQEGSVASRLVRYLNWTKRSDAAVQAIDSIAYVIPAA